jgi:hypothetical protein
MTLLGFLGSLTCLCTAVVAALELDVRLKRWWLERRWGT